MTAAVRQFAPSHRLKVEWNASRDRALWGYAAVQWQRRAVSFPDMIDGRMFLDFNKATNPPCAFTPYATCPLAPPENRLDFPVTAGEKMYRGAPH